MNGEPAIVAHRRKALPKRRGNSFYRDNRTFAAETLCGAPATGYDSISGQFREWFRTDGQKVVPCDDCLRLLRAVLLILVPSALMFAGRF